MSKMRQKVHFFKWSLTGFNSEFSFSKIDSHTKVKELDLPYYFSIAE